MAGGLQNIEAAKLKLEKQKLALEDKWKKRTYVWTILSALLTATIALAVPLLSSSDSEGISINLAVGPVDSCLASLKRLETISILPDQTVQNLTNAIGIHGELCKSTLETLSSELGKK